MCVQRKNNKNGIASASGIPHLTPPPSKFKVAKELKIHYIDRIMKLLKYTWLRRLLFVLLSCLSIWSCGVVYYMILSSLLIPYIAILLALYVTMLWKKKWRSRCASITATICLCLLVFYCAYPPSNDRPWLSSWEKLPEAIIQGDKLTIHQLRDFHYTSEHEFQNTYVNTSISTRQTRKLRSFRVSLG